MKQIVPFTKRITFDTSVDEITSISLDKKVKNIGGKDLIENVYYYHI